jgi:hypothetical protein
MASPDAPREVLLVGSVPLRPASAVFAAVGRRLAGLVKRIPDGDQHGWLLAASSTFGANQALEPDRRVRLSRDGMEVQLYRLRAGWTADGVTLGPYGYAKTAASSYAEFRRLRSAGLISQDVRFQVTLPGPGTSAYMIGLPADQLLPIARRALAREIRDIVAAIPKQDLTIQLDIAMEAEHEEWLRNPDVFDTPIHREFHWTLEEMTESAAWLADQVPTDVELGFHICSIWHHYQLGGQDNAVLVDTVNAIASRVTRSIDYVHVPTIPEHAVADFAPLSRLSLAPDTTLFVGVVHATDGVSGAVRRMRDVAAVVPEFGIASFCGFGLPQHADATDLPKGQRRGATSATLGAVLDLHRDAAQAGLAWPMSARRIR